MRLFGYAPQRGAAAGDTIPFYHQGNLRKGSAVERFVAGQVVASFRAYEQSDTNAWGLFVQEGAATFHDLTFRQ